MHYIDIILIALIAIFAIVGFARGLVDAILSLFSTIVSIALAVWVSKPFAGFLEQCFKLTSLLKTNISNMLIRWSESFGQALTSPQTGNQVIEASGLSGWQQTILKLITGECAIETGAKPADVFSSIIAPVALITIAGILAFVLIKLTVFILSRIFDALKKNRAINGLDKIFGFLLGAVKGALIICVLMGITIFIPNDKIIQEIDKTTITKVVYTPVTDFIRVNIADQLNEWADEILNKQENPKGTEFSITFNNNGVVNK